MSAQAVARETGLSLRYVQRLEAGERTPSETTVVALAHVLDLADDVVLKLRLLAHPPTL